MDRLPGFSTDAVGDNDGRQLVAELTIGRRPIDAARHAIDHHATRSCTKREMQSGLLRILSDDVETDECIHECSCIVLGDYDRC